MAIDAIRGYIQLASGLTELSRAKATEAAHAVLMLPAAVTSAPMVTQVTALADELLAAATTNRANLLSLVRSEVENAVERAGLVPAADLDRARAGLARLSADIEELREQILGSAALRSVTETGAAAIGALTGQGVRASTHDLGTVAAHVAAPAGADRTASAPRTSAPRKARVSKKTGPANKAGPANKTGPAKKARVSKKTGPAKKASPVKSGSGGVPSAKRAASTKNDAVLKPDSATKGAQKTTPSRRKSAAPVTKVARPSKTAAATSSRTSAAATKTAATKTAATKTAATKTAATKTAAATRRSGTPTKRGAAKKNVSTAPAAASSQATSSQVSSPQTRDREQRP